MSGFNTSTRRDDVSLKLRSSNMRQTREQTKKLEEESRRMEDRLKELKTAMNREKEERERQGGGFWGRGQSSVGSLTSYASEVLHTQVEKPVKEGKKKKIKILQDEPIEVPKRSSQPGTVKYIAQRKLTTGPTTRDKQKGPKCGQCEERSATLSCVQCSEIYCAGCFAAFHLKGALKQHRSCPISAIGGRVCMSPRPGSEIISPRESHASGSVVSAHKQPQSGRASHNGSEASGPSSHHSHHPSPRHQAGVASVPHHNQQHPHHHGNSEHNDDQDADYQQSLNDSTLLQGDYDESESAASFQQALLAWRKGDESPKSRADNSNVNARKYSGARPIASPVKDPVVGVDCSTGTVEQTHAPNIKFTGSLSYVEKLMLKKHRRTELGEMDTPRFGDDQSNTSSRQSSRYQSSDEVTSRKSGSMTTPSGTSRRDGRHKVKETSFVAEETDRVDFQSLYNAVLSAEESSSATPRSDTTFTDVTNDTSPDVPSRYPANIATDSSFTHAYSETMPHESWTGQEKELTSAMTTPRSTTHSRMSQRLPQEVSATMPPDSKYHIEDMFSKGSTNSPISPHQSDPLSRDFYSNPASNSISGISLVSDKHDHAVRQGAESRTNVKQGWEQASSLIDDNSDHQLNEDASFSKAKSKSTGSNRPKSSLRKDRPKSSMSRPGSRAQSRAASRMKMADGLLTKTPSQALSQIANLAGQESTNHHMMSDISYQSPLEGFFLAGVDLSTLAQDGVGGGGGGQGLSSSSSSHMQRGTTPRNKNNSTTTSSSNQRPGSRAGLKSSHGNRETIKVSNRLYQMAPRSWRPDSSLGDVIPLDAVSVDEDALAWQQEPEEEEEMVLSYSYGGQMSGRATQWRPASSQSSRTTTPSSSFAEATADFDHNKSHHATNKPKRSQCNQSNHINTNSPTPTPPPSTPTPTPPPSTPTPTPQRETPTPTPSKTTTTRLKSGLRRSLGTPDPLKRQKNSPALSSTTNTPTPNHQSSSSSLYYNQQHQFSDSNPISKKSTTTKDNSTPRTISRSSIKPDVPLLPSKSDFSIKSNTTANSNKPSISSARQKSAQSSSKQDIVNKSSAASCDDSVNPIRSSSVLSSRGIQSGKLRQSQSLSDKTNSSSTMRRSSTDAVSKGGRPSSSTSVTHTGSRQKPGTPGDQGQRPNSSSTYHPVTNKGSSLKTPMKPSVSSSQSLETQGRQDSIIADVMISRTHHADGWMDGDEDNKLKTERQQSSRTHDQRSQWETEVRPFTRESLDSAKFRGQRTDLEPGTERNTMSSRPSSCMSGRESRAVVMDGDDLSVYDSMQDADERNFEDKEALEQLEWELASDTGRLTADGKVSRLYYQDQVEGSGSFSSSRSSSGRSIKFSADRDYDLNSKLIEIERQAEQASLNGDMERNMTMDEDDVRALQ